MEKIIVNIPSDFNDTINQFCNLKFKIKIIMSLTF